MSISFAVTGDAGWYVPVAHEGMQSVAQLDLRIPFWRNSSRGWKIPISTKAGQHLKYDRHVFANHGIALNGVVHDTLLESYVLDSRHSIVWMR